MRKRRRTVIEDDSHDAQVDTGNQNGTQDPEADGDPGSDGDDEVDAPSTPAPDASATLEGTELRGALAAIALASTPAERSVAASDVATRLVEAAHDGDTAALSALLRAHPRREATVWRVAQFRLGDVTPSTSSAHDDPCAAVLGLVRPGDGALVAGELVAVDADGSAWTAISRTDDEVVVQLPSPRTIVGPAAAPDAVGPLLLAWRTALAARRPGVARAPAPAAAPDEAATASEPVPVAEDAVPEKPVPVRPRIAAPTAGPTAPVPPASEPAPEPATTPKPPGPDRDLVGSLDGLDAPGAPLDRLRAALQADLAARLNAVEARLTLAAEEGARIAVARALDEIRDELRQLREQLAQLARLDR